jgi:hypothetical protein
MQLMPSDIPNKTCIDMTRALECTCEGPIHHDYVMLKWITALEKSIHLASQANSAQASTPDAALHQAAVCGA